MTIKVGELTMAPSPPFQRIACVEILSWKFEVVVQLIHNKAVLLLIARSEAYFRWSLPSCVRGLRQTVALLIGKNSRAAVCIILEEVRV